MIIKAKRFRPGAKLPAKSRPDDAGFDLHCVQGISVPPKCVATIGTGVCLELPSGFYAQIVGRSGLGSRGVAVLAGCVDSTYRGEVSVVLANLGDFAVDFRVGDRIAQFVLLAVPAIAIEEVDELNPSERGSAGFGSSGR